MRRADRDRLEQPCGIPSDLPTPGPATAFGAEVPQLQLLEEAVVATVLGHRLKGDTLRAVQHRASKVADSIANASLQKDWFY